jgi:hypothetical protein
LPFIPAILSLYREVKHDLRRNRLHRGRYRLRAWFFHCRNVCGGQRKRQEDVMVYRRVVGKEGKVSTWMWFVKGEEATGGFATRTAAQRFQREIRRTRALVDEVTKRQISPGRNA